MTLGTGIARGALVLALLLPPGCAARDPAREAAEASARNQALIVAGNQAYRGGKYELAAKRYAAAAVAKKDDPAAYFGMGMALSRLGRIDEARVAYARSRELARARPRRGRRARRGAGRARRR
jgi:Flp pilus assembly protein TadD